MTREEDVNWMINITADIGKAEHQGLRHYEQTLLKKAVVDAVKNAVVLVAWDDEADDYDVADIAIKATKRSVIESIDEALSSAQPERDSGEWIRNDNGTYSCSVCQSWIPEEQHFYARYCLYCGSKMERRTYG